MSQANKSSWRVNFVLVLFALFLIGCGSTPPEQVVEEFDPRSEQLDQSMEEAEEAVDVERSIKEGSESISNEIASSQQPATPRTKGETAEITPTPPSIPIDDVRSDENAAVSSSISPLAIIILSAVIGIGLLVFAKRP